MIFYKIILKFYIHPILLWFFAQSLLKAYSNCVYKVSTAAWSNWYLSILSLGYTYNVNRNCVILYLSLIFDQATIYLSSLFIYLSVVTIYLSSLFICRHYLSVTTIYLSSFRVLKSPLRIRNFPRFAQRSTCCYTIFLVYYESFLLVGDRFVSFIVKCLVK